MPILRTRRGNCDGGIPGQGILRHCKGVRCSSDLRERRKLHIMDMPTALKKREQFRLQWMSMMFEGTDGWIVVSRNGSHAEPKSLLREIIGPDEIRLQGARTTAETSSTQ